MGPKERLQDDLKAAMKAGDVTRRDTLRLIQAAIRQVEVDKRITVNDEQVYDLLSTEAKKRRDSIDEARNAGRGDIVGKEQAELDLIELYLPQQLSREELEAEVRRAIAEIRRHDGQRDGRRHEGAHAARQKPRRWQTRQRGGESSARRLMRPNRRQVLRARHEIGAVKLARGGVRDADSTYQRALTLEAAPRRGAGHVPAPRPPRADQSNSAGIAGYSVPGRGVCHRRLRCACARRLGDARRRRCRAGRYPRAVWHQLSERGPDPACAPGSGSAGRQCLRPAQPGRPPPADSGCPACAGLHQQHPAGQLRHLGPETGRSGGHRRHLAAARRVREIAPAFRRRMARRGFAGHAAHRAHHAQ